jgi:hypothetical protein
VSCGANLTAEAHFNLKPAAYVAIMFFLSMNLQGAAKFAAAAEGSFVVSLCQSVLRVLPKHFSQRCVLSGSAVQFSGCGHIFVGTSNPEPRVVVGVLAR